MGFVYNLLFFTTVKEFWNQLRFDKVITHFLGHSVLVQLLSFAGACRLLDYSNPDSLSPLHPHFKRCSHQYTLLTH